MKPILTYYMGFHDSSITIYEPDTDKMFVYEFDRIIGVKHALFRQSGMVSKDFIFCQNSVLDLYGSKEFSNVYIKFNSANLFSNTPYVVERTSALSDFTGKLSVEDKIITTYGAYESSDSIHHHDAHAWCGYGQSGFDNAFVISFDAGGDDTHFRTATFRNKKQITGTNYGYHISKFYQSNSYPLDEVYANTSHGYTLGVAGKVMALAAYSNPKPRDVTSLVHRNRDFHEHRENLITCESYRNMAQEVFGIDDQRFGAYTAAHFLEKFPENRGRVSINGAAQYTIAATLQSFFEETLIDIIKEHFIDDIKLHDNNLILTGGSAMNVLANEKIRETFPDINVYVPPNPEDGGLSVGMMFREMSRLNLLKRTDYDLRFAGPAFSMNDRDLHNRPKFFDTEVTIEEIGQRLRDGKVIGLIQGNVEVGPRALGHRSIICDASIRTAKEKLNSNIKFREWFRPYAAACRAEDCDKYFESSSFDNMEHMSYVAKVKPEYQKELNAVTHIDDTTRLHVVDQETNPLFYDILTAFDGVLLNTSFNRRGEPIINNLVGALKVLARTTLDALVLHHEDRYYWIEKNDTRVVISGEDISSD